MRAENEWAEIEAGNFKIGLHKASEHGPKPGTSGSISIGFNVTEPIEKVVATLKDKGVQFRGPIADNDPVKLAFFGDPDGNSLYLCESKH